MEEPTRLTKEWTDIVSLLECCLTTKPIDLDGTVNALKGLIKKSLHAILDLHSEIVSILENYLDNAGGDMMNLNGAELLKCYRQTWVRILHGCNNFDVIISKLTSNYFWIMEGNFEKHWLPALWEVKILIRLQDCLMMSVYDSVHDQREDNGSLIYAMTSSLRYCEHMQGYNFDYFRSHFAEPYINMLETKFSNLCTEKNEFEQLLEIFRFIENELGLFPPEIAFDKMNNLALSMFQELYVYPSKCADVAEYNPEYIVTLYKVHEELLDENVKKSVVQITCEHLLSSPLPENDTLSQIVLQIVEPFKKITERGRRNQFVDDTVSVVGDQIFRYFEFKGNRAYFSAKVAQYIDSIIRESIVLFGNAEMQNLVENDYYSIFFAVKLVPKEIYPIFQNSYEDLLLSRVLNVALDLEFSTLNIIMEVVNYELATALGILSDLRKCEECNSEYIHLQKSLDLQLESLSVKVFKQDLFQKENFPHDIKIPDVLMRSTDVYKQSSCLRFGAKVKINFLLLDGSVEIKLLYAEDSCVSMKPIQSVVLLHYMATDTLTFSELHALTRIPTTTLARCIQGLMDFGLLILDDNILSSSSRIFLNLSLKSGSSKTQLLMPETADFKKEARDFRGSKSNAVRAAIVRVLKSSGSLSPQHLQAEVKVQLEQYFEPDEDTFQESITWLIEMEYIGMDDQRREYIYIV